MRYRHPRPLDGAGDGAAVLTIRLLDTAFAEGRAFTLGRA